MSYELHDGDLYFELRDQFNNIGHGHRPADPEAVAKWLREEGYSVYKAMRPESSHDKDWWAGVLGEGIHTAFRKGTDHPESHKYWEMIRDMPNELWGEVLAYVVWSLGYMKLIEVEES